MNFNLKPGMGRPVLRTPENPPARKEPSGVLGRRFRFSGMHAPFSQMMVKVSVGFLLIF